MGGGNFVLLGRNLVPFCFLLFSRLCAADNPGKFWHVTDFHYDHTYWTSQLSCNADVANPSPIGNYWCDSPWKLITTAIQAMNTYDPDVDFLLWTGDTVAHIEDDHLNVTINMDILQNLTDALNSVFPSKKIYATFGNHDYYPSNQFPNFNNIIYNRTAEMWEDWIGADQMNNFRKGGYYTRKTEHGQRILALNTNLYYTSDKQTPGIEDPSDQIQWMRSVLQAARNANETVIVTAHIPPGLHTPRPVLWFQEEFVEPVNSVLQDFADVIVGMHFGHDHHDGFKVFYNKQGKASAPLFVAPSVTPWRYKLKNGQTGPPHNPSIRLVTYDRDSGRHLNIEQLRLDLPTSIAEGTANFTLLYSFTEHYKVPDITAASLEKLVRRMGTGSEGDQLLDDYYRFTTAGATQEETCDKKCKFTILCGFQHYTNDVFDKCVEDYVSAAPSLSGTGFTSAVFCLALLQGMVKLLL